MPKHMVLNVDGRISGLQTPENLSANLALRGSLQDVRFVKQLLPKSVNSTIKIPTGIDFNAKVKAQGPQYAANMLLYEGGGNATVRASLNKTTEPTT